MIISCEFKLKKIMKSKKKLVLFHQKIKIFLILLKIFNKILIKIKKTLNYY
jgi:hypothetical protein